MDINGILFDKDGTLFSYTETWNTWCSVVIEKLSAGQTQLAKKLAAAIEFDLETKKILPQSLIISGTSSEVAVQLGKVIPEWEHEELEKFLNEQVIDMPLCAVVPLKEYFELLRRQGLKLGVMTNDSQENAYDQLVRANVNPSNDLDFVAGYDSGYGSKPDSAPLLAFARAAFLDPSQIVMVGDSLHDLIAGKRAGMKTIGVLTGIAKEIDLIDDADAILPDISHIPKFLEKFRL